MMKHNIIFFLATAFLALSCSKEVQELATEKDRNAGFELNLITNIEGMDAVAQTKADLLNSWSDIPGNSFTLYGWDSSSKVIDGSTATYSSDKWTLSPGYTMDEDKDYTFFATANLPSSGASITMPGAGSGNVTFAVTDITKAQKDVLIGKGSKSKPTDGDVSIDFTHPYSSVKFKFGNADGVEKITAISLTGVYEKGTATCNSSSSGYSWNVSGSTAGATLSASSLNLTQGDSISFVVIPQNLSSNQAVLSVTYNTSSETGKTMAKLLNTGSWDAGITTVYSIDKIGTIIVVVSADGKTITNNGSSKAYVRATITGAWYESSSADAPVVAPWSITDGSYTGLFSDSSWTPDSEGFYYLTNALASGAKATVFSSYSKPSKPSGLGSSAELRLSVQIQAIPYNANYTCLGAFAAL